MGLRSSTRASQLSVTAGSAWAVLASGRTGRRWYVDAAPFVFRAAVDRAAGGREPGPPPGRALLEPGDEAGIWLVREADGEVLELEAQVWAPGTVLLHNRLQPTGRGCRLVQTVSFRPDGLLGSAYLVADLPARELLISLVHRRVCADLSEA